MKTLLVGPYPPPHGGISVHVWSAHALMKRAGQQSNVLNVDPRAPESGAYIRVSGAVDLGLKLFRHTLNGWTLSVHTNGHNVKSWLISLLSGFAAQFGPGATLTLHSGLVPSYLEAGQTSNRLLARISCRMYERVVCVNTEIAEAIASLGISRERLDIKPAFLPIETPEVSVPEEIENWLRCHSPVISSALFFRPEYGFELLVPAIARLRLRHPKIGCLVMGTAENREAAAQLIAKAGLGDNIMLAGDLDHELCLALMSRSDVFVRPTFRDGDSISVREADALGVPVVASNVGTRPAGVRLFEAGNVDGLVESLGQVLVAAVGLGRSRAHGMPLLEKLPLRGARPADAGVLPSTQSAGR